MVTTSKKKTKSNGIVVYDNQAHIGGSALMLLAHGGGGDIASAHGGGRGGIASARGERGGVVSARGGGRDGVRSAHGGRGGGVSACGGGRVGVIPARGGGGSVVSARSGGSTGSIRADGFLTPDQGRLGGFIAIAEYEKVMRENVSLKKIIAQMEQNATAVVKKGRSSFDKKNWTGIDYANDHKIREYCREKIWPIYSRLSEGWNVYSENNRSLCARIMAIVDVEPGRSLKGLWLQNCAPSVNRLFIDMMSKETASCKKQFKGKCFY